MRGYIDPQHHYLYHGKLVVHLAVYHSVSFDSTADIPHMIFAYHPVFPLKSGNASPIVVEDGFGRLVPGS